MSFETYYKNLGFSKYPFGIFTSEGERDVHDDIYLTPPSHSVILEGLKNTSAIIVGERGTGKTALSVDLGLRLQSDKNLLVKIDEFSNLPVGYDENALYRFLTERIVAAFFLDYVDRPSALWKLRKEDRIELSMFLHSYLGASSKSQLISKIKKIQNHPIKRWLIGAYNAGRVTLNYGLRAAAKLANDLISQNFSSLPPMSEAGDYFARLNVEVDTSFERSQREYFYLERICKIAQATGFEKIYIFIDKVDEDPRFQNDAEDISDFLKVMLSNNKILTSNLFHLVFLVWATPFNNIKDVVRTQKLSFSSLSWNTKELREVLERRLKAYSSNKNQTPPILSACSSEKVALLLDMCNRNPRDLWHLLDKSFQEQFKLDPSSHITDPAIDAAVRRFVTDFNYYEYYPRRSNARANTMDVYKYIKHLLKLDGTKFTKDKLNELAGTGGSTSNYVVAMENMGLIKNSKEKAQGGAVVYEIVDPKVKYAMEHGIAVGE
jgi:hypothetical protein